VPIAFITAKDGKNVQTVLNLAQNLNKQAVARVSTGELNRVLRHALEQQAPPLRQNRRPKVFYATQVAAHPPTIVLFTNGPELFDNTYLRYLLKMFRDHLPFHDVPIKLYLRRKRRQDKDLKEEHTYRAKAGGDNARRSRSPRTSARKRQSSGHRREPEMWKDL
jgi:GTP-binding protein